MNPLLNFMTFSEDRSAERKVALLRELLRETIPMGCLRVEANRDWLNRRNAALGLPVEQPLPTK